MTEKHHLFRLFFLSFFPHSIQKENFDVNESKMSHTDKLKKLSVGLDPICMTVIFIVFAEDKI